MKNFLPEQSIVNGDTNDRIVPTAQLSEVYGAESVTEVDTEFTVSERAGLEELLAGVDDDAERERITFFYKQSVISEHWYQQQRDMSEQ